jgi:hypothetical protein
MGTPGFRFREGTDDDPPFLSSNFHDGKEDTTVRPFYKPDMDPGSDEGEAPAVRPSRPSAPAAAVRETSFHASDEWEQFRSSALKNAPRQRNDAVTGASGDDAVTCLDVSTAQLEAVIQRIMERVFVERVEAILQEVLEKAVEKEMRNFRRFLVKKMEKPGGSPGGSMEDGTI